MKKITTGETIEIFNSILERAKMPQRSIELWKDGSVVTRNRLGKVIDVMLVKEDADPIILIREVCKMITGEL